VNSLDLLRICRDEQLIDSYEQRGEIIRIRHAGVDHELTPDQAYRFASAILRHAPVFARLRLQGVLSEDKPER
jgi:hypothetical protein